MLRVANACVCKIDGWFFTQARIRLGVHSETEKSFANMFHPQYVRFYSALATWKSRAGMALPPHPVLTDPPLPPPFAATLVRNASGPAAVGAGATLTFNGDPAAAAAAAAPSAAELRAHAAARQAGLLDTTYWDLDTVARPPPPEYMPLVLAFSFVTPEEVRRCGVC